MYGDIGAALVAEGDGEAFERAAGLERLQRARDLFTKLGLEAHGAGLCQGREQNAGSEVLTVQAATLNAAFDDAGVGKCTLPGNCDFGFVSGTLGMLVYGACVADALAFLNEEFVDCDTVALPAALLCRYRSSALRR